MTKKSRTPNDQRATVKNPTSKEYELDKLNSENQSVEMMFFGNLFKEKEVPKKKGK